MGPKKLIRWSAMFKTDYMEYLEGFNKKVSRAGQCHVWDIFYEFDSGQVLDNGRSEVCTF